MFVAFSNAARDHTVNGDWCTCGELATDCWFHAIFYPYRDKCADAVYGSVFASVDDVN